MFNDIRKKHVAIAPSFGCTLSSLGVSASSTKRDIVSSGRDQALVEEEAGKCVLQGGTHLAVQYRRVCADWALRMCLGCSGVSPARRRHEHAVTDRASASGRWGRLGPVSGGG